MQWAPAQCSSPVNPPLSILIQINKCQIIPINLESTYNTHWHQIFAFSDQNTLTNWIKLKITLFLISFLISQNPLSLSASHLLPSQQMISGAVEQQRWRRWRPWRWRRQILPDFTSSASDLGRSGRWRTARLIHIERRPRRGDGGAGERREGGGGGEFKGLVRGDRGFDFQIYDRRSRGRRWGRICWTETTVAYCCSY